MLQDLAIAAINGGDFGGALQLIRQLEQIHADLPGWLARVGSNILIGALIESGELAAAEQLCTTVLTQARDAGDLRVLGSLLDLMADLDLRAGWRWRARPGRRWAPGSSSSMNGSASWSPWWLRAAPTPRSPPGCVSACVRSAPAWAASVKRPAAAAST